MKKVLLVNVPSSVAQWLELRLGALEVVAAAGEAQLGALQDDGSWDLSVIQHQEGPFSSRHVLERLREGPGRNQTPILYVLDSAPEAHLLKELVDRFRVNQVMVHPIVPEALLSEVSRHLKLAPARGSSLQDAVKALWDKYRPSVEEQLVLLEEVGRQLLEGELPQALRREAQQIAHQLAGKLGSYGFPQGSTLALRLDGMLRLDQPISARDYADLVLHLRQVLESDPNSEAPTENLARQVLVLDSPSRPLPIPVQERDYEVLRVQHPGQAQQQLSANRPIAILVHLGVEQEHQQRLEFLQEASQRHPDLPVIAFVPNESLFSKVEALRHGAQRILDSDLTPQQLGALIGSITHSHAKKVTRVLIVDDDHDLADYVETILHRAGMITEHIDSPATLLDTLHRFSPDALLVDYELPVMSGLEICRLLRGIPRWQTLPLILITGSSQRDVATLALESGADDFMAKPLKSGELLARIHNRLERNRRLLELAGTDPVTGLTPWARSGPRVRSLMHLARRLSRPFSLVALQLDPKEGRDPVEGDRLLVKLGELLLSQLRGEDVTSRHEAEHIVLGLFGLRRSDGLDRIQALQSRFQATTGATFSAGLVVFPHDAETLDGLLQAAIRQLDEARQRSPGAISTPESSGLAGGGVRSRVDVALVDDDGLLGPLLVHALQKRGYTTLWIRDGLEAGRRLASEQALESARLILLEVDLPGQSGYNLLRQLKANGKLTDTQVLFVSARSTQNDVLTGLELGATDHVSKPFTLPVLMEKVRRALQS